MILVSSKRIRPVFRYENRQWHRYDQYVESTGHSIKICDKEYDEKVLRDLTSELGVVSYGLRVNDVLTVFDFSAMHLCPCQLSRVKVLL